MRKKYLSALLFGALLFASAGTFTSCKDYDDDIANLQEQVDKVVTDIKTLQDAAGKYVTSVVYDATTGKLTVTGGNGETFMLPASTNLPSYTLEVKDGNVNLLKDGEVVSSSTLPSTSDTFNPELLKWQNGYLYYGDTKIEDVKEPSGASITDIKDGEKVIGYTITIGDDTATFYVTSELKSLVFIPEVVVDGVPGMVYSSFSYNAITLANKDKQTEKSVESTKATLINPVIKAQYHVNPSNANIEELKDKFNFVIKKNVDYKSSRAEASEDFGAKAEFESFENGILTVKVNVTGSAATEEYISLLALEVKKENGETVTSDYATIVKEDLNDIVIAKPSVNEIEDLHYRTLIDDYDTKSYIDDVKVWSDNKDGVSVDAEFEYTDQLDLLKLVETHKLKNEDECLNKLADLDKLGLKYKFEIVNSYNIGNPATPQDQFVKFVDGSNNTKIEARVYDADPEVGNRAAIGRTPIIRVTLLDGENIVKVAYIKVRITDTKVNPDNKTIDLNVDAFKFECGKSCMRSVSVEEINKKIYNELGLSFEQFCNKYPVFEDVITTDVNGVGTVESTENETNPETKIVTWTLTEDQLWTNAGKEITNIVRYYSADKASYVEFKLKSTVEGVQKVYDIDATKYINNYWDAQKTYAKFSVSVPLTENDTDSDNCLFINDLNSPFVTWSDGENKGIVVLDKAVTKVEYFFDKAITKVTKIGDVNVSFSIVGDILYATVNGVTEKIATVDNTGATFATNGTRLENAVTYNKQSSIAKQLLNTGEMFAYIGARGYVCGSTDKTVEITFKGSKYFEVKFIRPVNISAVAADNYIDGVDFGEKGSSIKINDLINPYDWRDRYFSKYTNYYQYYGPFSTQVDFESVMCDLNTEAPTAKEITLVGGEKVKAIALPSTIEFKEDGRGNVTYKNNGTKVNDDFNIYIKVKVTYGWGVILTDYITVPVKATITQN